MKRKSDTFIHNHHYKHGLINLSFQAFILSAPVNIWLKCLSKDSLKGCLQKQMAAEDWANAEVPFVYSSDKQRKKNQPKTKKPNLKQTDKVFFLPHFLDVKQLSALKCSPGILGFHFKSIQRTVFSLQALHFRRRNTTPFSCVHRYPLPHESAWCHYKMSGSFTQDARPLPVNPNPESHFYNIQK